LALIGHFLLAIPYWIFLIGFSLFCPRHARLTSFGQAFGTYWTFLIGHFLLDIPYWLFLIGYSLLFTNEAIQQD
jgi:hypothetical protein